MKSCMISCLPVVSTVQLGGELMRSVYMCLQTVIDHDEDLP